MCELCNYKCTSKTDILSHKLENHEQKLSCKKCNFSASKLDEMKDHKIAEHPAVLHVCEHCDFETVHENQLLKHSRNNHLLKFECKRCNFRAKDASDLTSHFKTKHAAPQFPYDQCSYKACSYGDLNRHKRGMHQENKDTRSRYFTRSKHSNVNDKSSYETSRRKPTKDNNEHTPSPSPSFPAQYPEDQSYRCTGECDSVEKTFTHKDELDLHMKFYHKSSQ